MTEKANSSFLEELPFTLLDTEQYNSNLNILNLDKIRKRKITKIVKREFYFVINIDDIVKTLLTYEWLIEEEQLLFYYKDKRINVVADLLEIIDKHCDLFPLTEKLFVMLSSVKLRDKYIQCLDVYNKNVIDFCFDLGYGYVDDNKHLVYLYPHKTRFRKGYYSKNGEYIHYPSDVPGNWTMLHNYIHNYIITV